MLKNNPKDNKDVRFHPDSYYSEDYTKFKFGANRKIKQPHVKKLAKSISKMGFIPQFRVLVTRKNFVIDGQHRILASQIAQKGYYYEYCDQASDIIAILNTLNLKWTGSDFVDYYSHYKRKGYVKLQELISQYKDFSFASIMSILRSIDADVVNKIRQGEFDFESYSLVVKLINHINSFSDYVPLYKSSRFIRAFLAFYKTCKNYNHSKMYDAVRRNKKRFVSGNETKFYQKIFQEIYNG